MRKILFWYLKSFKNMSSKGTTLNIVHKMIYSLQCFISIDALQVALLEIELCNTLLSCGFREPTQVVLFVIYPVSFTVYHPRTGYSNRSRCSSTSSSVASPSLVETPPPPPTQTQRTASENRPPPTKQVSWKSTCQTVFVKHSDHKAASQFTDVDSLQQRKSFLVTD